MTATLSEGTWGEAGGRLREGARREDELASLSAHLAAPTARWLELAWELCECGEYDDAAGCLAFRCGLTRREAGECLRLAGALRGLPATRAAFARGELSFTKVRALTRVATVSSEAALVELAGALTAAQLERALRAFRRVRAAEARETHELEFVDYFFDEDGTLYLRARLAAEDGTAPGESAGGCAGTGARPAPGGGWAGAGPGPAGGVSPEPPRPLQVEALLDLAERSLAPGREPRGEPARLVVHVDADALLRDGGGRCEVEDGPSISPETARRRGCDAEVVAQVERDGLPVSVGRRRRTVPRALRRLLSARAHETCAFPGCERRRRLQAHHRRHWAQGGETSLDNLVLLCFHHHRLVHEGGYTVEDDPAGGLRFRNRHDLLVPRAPSRPPPRAGGDAARRARAQRARHRPAHRPLRQRRPARPRARHPRHRPGRRCTRPRPARLTAPAAPP